MAEPAVYSGAVYFTSRDQHCYCLDVQEGKRRWKVDLESPILAAPMLVETGAGMRLYVVTSTGEVYRLEPATGKVCWRMDVSEDTRQTPLLCSAPAVGTTPDGKRRQLYFGCGFRDMKSEALNMKGGIGYCLEDRLEDAP